MNILEILIKNTNWVDIFIVICLIRTTYMGFSRGFSGEIPRFLSLFLLIVLTYHFYGELGQFLSEHTLLSQEVALKLSFISLVIILTLFFKLVCVFLRLTIKLSGPVIFEIVTGLIVGVLRGILLASLVLAFFQFLFPTYLNKSIYEGSFLGSKIINLGPRIYETVSQFKKS